MASTLHKFGASCDDIITLAQLPSSSSHQSEEHEPLKTEVAPNNARSMTIDTLQLRLSIHKISLLSLLSPQNWNIGLIFCLGSFAVGQIFL